MQAIWLSWKHRWPVVPRPNECWNSNGMLTVRRLGSFPEPASVRFRLEWLSLLLPGRAPLSLCGIKDDGVEVVKGVEQTFQVLPVGFSSNLFATNARFGG